jgi:hypothetical protein
LRASGALEQIAIPSNRTCKRGRRPRPHDGTRSSISKT